jgi:hypothetical protein
MNSLTSVDSINKYQYNFKNTNIEKMIYDDKVGVMDSIRDVQSIVENKYTRLNNKTYLTY